MEGQLEIYSGRFMRGIRKNFLSPIFFPKLNFIAFLSNAFRKFAKKFLKRRLWRRILGASAPKFLVPDFRGAQTGTDFMKNCGVAKFAILV